MNLTLDEVLEKHLEIGAADLESVADSFSMYAWGHVFWLYDRPKDCAMLDQIYFALACLEDSSMDRLSTPALETLHQRLHFGPDSDDDEAKARAYFDSIGKESVRAFSGITKYATEVRKVVKTVRREIEDSDQARRSLSQIKLERLQVVETAVDFWRRYNKRDVPKTDLKPAQPFSFFLADLFLAMEVDSTPRKAFASWLKQSGPLPPLQPE